MYGFKATKKIEDTGATLYEQVDDLFKPGRPDLLDRLMEHARNKRADFMARRHPQNKSRKKRPVPSPPPELSSDPEYSSNSSDEVRVRKAPCQSCVAAHKATAKTLDIVYIQAREIAELKKQIAEQGWLTREFTRPVKAPVPVEPPVPQPAIQSVLGDADEPEWKRVLEEIVRSSDDSSMQLEWMVPT